MRTPPLCQLWQLTEAGPGTYSLCDLADFNEAMDMEDEFSRRMEEARTRKKSSQ